MFLLVGVASILLLLHTTRMGWFVCDDAYITLRYAWQWATNGAPFFNNPGEPVEGYTSFSWMTILALAHALHLNAAFLALLLGAASGIVILSVLPSLAGILADGEKNRCPRIALSIFLLAMSAGFSPFAFWVSTGMETMAFTALLLLAARSTLRFSPTRRSAAAMALLWGATALTRPEGIFLGATAFAWLLFSISRQESGRRPALLHAGAALLGFSVIVAAHLVWRRLTYGYWVPLTYHAKVSGIDPLFLARHGAAYVHAFFSSFFLYPLAGIALLAVLPGTDALIRRAWTLPFLIVTAYCAHVVRSGGDFMAMFRFLVPIWPFFLLLVASGLLRLSQLIEKIRFHEKTKAFVLPVLLAAAAIPVLASSWKFENASLASERPQFMMESTTGMIHFAQDRVRVGRILRAVLPEPVRDVTFMVVGGAGAISYESRIGRIVDTFGLLDPEVARMRIEPGSFTKPGHLKQASPQRIRSFDADILCNPGVAWIGSGQPPKNWFANLQLRWPGYTPFCVVASLSRDDRGMARTHYCCLRKQDRLQNLTLHTVAP